MNIFKTGWKLQRLAIRRKSSPTNNYCTSNASWPKKLHFIVDQIEEAFIGFKNQRHFVRAPCHAYVIMAKGEWWRQVTQVSSVRKR